MTTISKTMPTAPDAPLRSSPSTFATKGAAWLSYWETVPDDLNEWGEQVNTVASEINTHKTNAETAEAKAEDWADANEDVEVETGKYSAKHWSAKAEGHSSDAEGFATDAETSKDTALAAVDSIDSFVNRYFDQPTQPPIVEGYLWWDSANNIMKVCDGSSYVEAGSAVNGTSSRESYTATDGQTTFAVLYDVGFVDVYQNGLKLLETDFTATSGTNIVLDTGAAAGDSIDIIAYGTFSIADHYTQAQSDARYYIRTNDLASQSEAEAGTDNTKLMTPLRTDQLITVSVASKFTWSLKTEAYTASNGDKILADTTTAAFSITLPSTPSLGDNISISDVMSSWATNNLTVNGNGKNVGGSATFTGDIDNGSFVLIYNGTEWIVSNFFGVV